ncbi:FdhD protein [Tenacibaculum sp. MAR_2009_124]|uniref:formate dehydrogenase accessory sulfurtransferase FdhD n=1 Tax=Tenacibaculum sp. MAR_2009_124 TaxID=1250059 RepID=UPI00089642FB|nr:formate dehydrogenase accessory sulfurtransferase FdhD [Tenacibaculum sp. MAR_2009_124]SEB50846.1 FdhD protein [Tenacibaculum sp. MAR_2009_124]
MEQVRAYDAIKASLESSLKLEDRLVVEAPLQININNQPYTVVMRTPGDDEYLIRGLLFAEDIFKKQFSFNLERVDDDHEYFNNILNVIISKDDLGKGYLNKRTLLSVSSCGICGKKEIEDLKVEGKALHNQISLSLVEIQAMFDIMIEQQNTFELTGGSHACAIFDKSKNIITLKEDIGRHNAVDKCIGHLLESNKLSEATIMLVSGRVSYEIVSKAFFAKTPIIVAVSACSSLAVDFAKEFGICLIGFTRQNKMTIYSNPQYIL